MRIAIAWMCVMLFVGCSSIRTSMWTRAEDDNLLPDGTRALKGMPVMLKVPSHIEIKVIETLYAAHDPDQHQIQVVKLDRPDLKVDAQLKYTEKMFLVDPQRVGAGTGEYGFGFAPGSGGTAIPSQLGDNTDTAGHGYLHSANYKADDQTITASASLLASVLSFAPAGARSSSVPQQMNLATIDRVVAFRRFDLGSPTVDEEVFAFLEEHVNHCHSCANVAGRSFIHGREIDVPAPAKTQDGH